MKLPLNWYFVCFSFVFSAVSAQYSVDELASVGLYPDSEHAPFIYGVASGDPKTDGFILWTKLHPSDSSKTETIYWEVSESVDFNQILANGTATTNRQRDFNIKVDVSGLAHTTNYHYRFYSKSAQSVSGEARTLPGLDAEEVKFGFVSCSCVFAGFFNAYRRMAERDDLEFIVHLGDYVYDYPDKHQLNRIIDEPPKDVKTPNEWRERHRYYLMDPDLREARRKKTWIVIWDNHDIDLPDKTQTIDAMQVFYDHLPIRVPDENAPEKIYRQFKFGSLADLIMIDMFSMRGQEEAVEGVPSVLGREQDKWLRAKLLESDAVWRVIGNQEMMSDWLSEGAPKFVRKQSGDGRVFDDRSWGGYPVDRQRLFDFLEEEDIDNNLVLTGDIHMAFIMDLTGTPKDRSKYRRRKGIGAHGGEVCTPSISRINMHDAGVPRLFIKPVQWMSKCLNPHHHWVDFGHHGYTTIELDSTRVRTEVWFVPASKPTTRHKFRKGFEMRVGENSWRTKRFRRPFK